MKTTLIAAALAALTAFPAAALADCYVNPKGDIQKYETLHACHSWGASVRCDPSEGHTAYVTFYFKGDWDIACGVRITPNGAHMWHANTTTWYHYTPHHQLIECTQYWQNNNTLDVTGKRIK